MKSSARADRHGEGIPPWATPVCIFLIAFAARVYRLGDANLWWDEALAVWAVRKGLLGCTEWTAGDVHPPLYFWSLWAWVELFGETEFAMRALSASFGVLTVAVVYSLGRLIEGRVTASLGALLTALARFHIWWSQEMRMYVLAGLLGTLSLYLFLRWLRTEEASLPPRRPNRLLALYVLTSIGALYTVFLSGTFLLVENVVLLIVLLTAQPRARRRLLYKWIVAQVTVLLIVGIWLVVSWGRMRTWSVAEPLSLRFFARLYATLLTTGISVYIERYTWAVLFAFALLALGAGHFTYSWWQREKGRERDHQMLDALTLSLTVVLSGVLIYLASIPRGLFYTPHVEARYFIPFAPAFWLLLAWGVASIARHWPRVAWLGATGLMALWIGILPGYYGHRYLRDELQTMVRAVVSQAEDGDAVLLNSGGRYPIFLYHYERFPDTVWRPPMRTVSRSEAVVKAHDVEARLDEFAVSYDRIWLAQVDEHLTDPEGLVQKGLEERYERVFVQPYGHNALHLFAREKEPPSLSDSGYVPQHPVDLSVGVEGRLIGWELPVRTFPPQSTIRVSLLWERLPEEPVKVLLRNARGQILMEQQQESPHMWEDQRQQFDFPVHAATPAGQYEIALSSLQGKEHVLSTLRIEDTSPLPHTGEPDTPVDARLGEDIVLEGYSLRHGQDKGLDAVSPGDGVTLDLHWRAEKKLPQDYRVFVHFVGTAHNPATGGPVWGGHDCLPADGGYPTSQWFVGEVIVDRHVLSLDENAPPGEYEIEVGMYDPHNGERLPVTLADGAPAGDRLMLEESLYVGRKDAYAPAADVWGRYLFHTSLADARFSRTTATYWGRAGFFNNRIFASSRLLAPLRALQVLQAHTTLSHVVSPPRTLGTM
ncbi:MAG: glycosyltransferase family 39 protein [Anaerolineales bacterium]